LFYWYFWREVGKMMQILFLVQFTTWETIIKVTMQEEDTLGKMMQ